MEMGIVETTQNLPATIDGIAVYMREQTAKLAVYRELLRRVDGLGASHEMWLRALTDAQRIVKGLFMVEIRLGELLASMPLAEKRASAARGTCTLPEGITKKRSREARLFAAYP